MDFGMLIATTFLSLPPVIREMAPFGRGELACQVPEECWLLPNTEFGEVEFPLTLTIFNKSPWTLLCTKQWENTGNLIILFTYF